MLSALWLLLPSSLFWQYGHFVAVDPYPFSHLTKQLHRRVKKYCLFMPLLWLQAPAASYTLLPASIQTQQGMSNPEDGRPGSSSNTRLEGALDTMSSPAHSDIDGWRGPPQFPRPGRGALMAMHYARVDHVTAIGGDPYWLYYSCATRDCQSWIWCQKLVMGYTNCTKCGRPWIDSLTRGFVQLAVPADPRRATVPLGSNGLPAQGS